MGDLRAGKVGFGYVPSRDWAAAGDPGFQAVQAPFLLSTTTAATTLAGSPLADELLSGLDSSGVVGLALVPGEARRLIARTPITAAGDLEGMKIRISDSAQAVQLMTAWGCHPVAEHHGGPDEQQSGQRWHRRGRDRADLRGSQPVRP